MASRCWTE